ncbi:unnamed protein product, partial [Brenthis ino]
MTPLNPYTEVRPNIIITETTDSETETTTVMKEKVKYRWKNADPTKWKRNIELQKKRKCLPYSSKYGKLRAPKVPKSPKCSKNCRHKYADNFGVQKSASLIGLFKILSYKKSFYFSV